MDTQGQDNQLPSAWKGQGTLHRETGLDVKRKVSNACCLLVSFLKIFLEETLPHLLKDSNIFKREVQKRGQFLPSGLSLLLLCDLQNHSIYEK